MDTLFNAHSLVSIVTVETSISEESTDATPLPTSSTEEKDERRESLMLKIYSQMKTGRKKAGSVPSLGQRQQDKPITLREGNSLLCRPTHL